MTAGPIIMQWKGTTFADKQQAFCWKGWTWDLAVNETFTWQTLRTWQGCCNYIYRYWKTRDIIKGEKMGRTQER